MEWSEQLRLEREEPAKAAKLREEQAKEFVRRKKQGE